jgi:Contractile injection system tube protein
MFETAGNLKMFNMMMPVDEVTFDLNPSEFTITKQAYNNNKAQTKAGTSTSVPSATASPAGYVSLYRGTHPTVINFTALLTEEGSGVDDAVEDMTALGGGVKARCDMLLQWTQPGGGSMLGKVVGSAAAALGFKTQIVARPPLLTLQWGDPGRGFLLQGTLTSINISYLRFDTIGNPIRAQVRCGFTEAPSSLLSLLTNPTSGGVPGRRAHVMREGESLAGIATDSYGRPGAWRDIADSNRIDDPFRVRPGRSVLLPPADELT